MKLEGDYLFEASVPEVGSALFDPVILAAVMPGCEKLELVDGHYVGDIKVKVGPIQGNFTGKVDLQDKVEPESYTMIVEVAARRASSRRPRTSSSPPRATR